MSKAASKKTIAVDIDEVLAQFAESFVKFSNERWGTNLKPDDWDEHWSELWKINHKETDERAQVIYGSNVFKDARKLPEAERALRSLKKDYNLVILTSRHRAVSGDTLDWVRQNFGDLFSEIHFAGIWDDLEKDMLERLRATKAEVCKQIGADYLIDDAPKHCIAAANAGIKSLLFGNYRWNKDARPVRNMVRVKNWREVLEYFHADSK